MHQLRLQSALSGAAPSLLDGAIPSLLEDYLSPDAVGVGGGSSIVNATSWDAASGSFDVTSGPSMRMVVDLADLDKSTWVNVAGVSGHPESSHYDDQLNSWVAGETYPWPFTSAAVRAAGKETLTLHP
jgi:penicillin amidase